MKEAALLPNFDHPWVDEARAPLYVLRYPSTATSAEIETFYDSMTRWYESLTAPVAYVAIAKHVTHLPASDRSLIARRESVLAPFQQKYLRGTAFIAESSLTRGLIAAVFWINGPCYPWKTFANFEEGLGWARTRVQGENSETAPSSSKSHAP